MWNTDEVMAGLAIGGVGGLALGYELRRLVERFQRKRSVNKRDTITKRDLKKMYKHDKVVAIAEHSKPQVIPIVRSRRNTPANAGSEIHGWAENPDRDDVIAALMGSGYSKTAAVKATDACSMVERAHGLQQWTIAAFRNAHGDKS